MKGLAPAIAVVLIAMIAVVAEGIIMTNFIYKLDTIQHSARTIDIVQSIDLMESLRDAVKKSLDYSFYQSLYDVASKGGYDKLDSVKSLNCQPYWKVYSDQSYLSEDFWGGILRNIKSQTQEHFGIYKEQLQKVTRNQNIAIPEYEIIMDNSESSVTLTVNSKGKITASKELYTVSDTLNFKRDYDIDILKIYSTSKTEFINKDPLTNAISDADKNKMRAVSETCKNFDKEYCEVGEGCSGSKVFTCEDLLNENCENADDKFKSTIRGTITSVGNTLSKDYSEKAIGYSISILDSKTEHATKTSGPTAIGGGDTNAGCGCKEKVTECPDGADWNDVDNNICKKCPSDAQKVDLPNNICQKCIEYTSDDPETDEVNEEKCTNPTDMWQDAWTLVCKKGTYCKNFSLKCEYNYKGATLAKISATDLDNQYSVYDTDEKSIAPRNIELQFLELVSSPVDYNPIEMQTNSCPN